MKSSFAVACSLFISLPCSAAVTLIEANTSTAVIGAGGTAVASFTGVQVGDYVVISTATNRNDNYNPGVSTPSSTATIGTIGSVNTLSTAATLNTWIQYAAITAAGDLNITLTSNGTLTSDISSATAVYLLRPGTGETISLAGSAFGHTPAPSVGQTTTLNLSAAFAESLTNGFAIMNLTSGRTAGDANAITNPSGWTQDVINGVIRKSLSLGSVTGSSLSATGQTTTTTAAYELTGAMVVFTAIPEPAAALLGGLGLLTLLRRRR